VVELNGLDIEESWSARILILRSEEVMKIQSEERLFCSGAAAGLSWEL
jgi:hypothetical protein